MKTSVQKGRRWKGVGRGPHFRTLAAEKPVGRRFWRRVGEGYVPAGSATQLQSPRARACSTAERLRVLLVVRPAPTCARHQCLRRRSPDAV